MSQENGSHDAERRRLLKLAAFGLASAPFVSSLLAGTARAADLPLVDEKDPTATALKYTCDGAKNPERKDAAASCETLYLVLNPLFSPGAWPSACTATRSPLTQPCCLK